EALRARLGPELDVPELDPDEAVSNAAVILFGGVETTEGMIANALYHLLAHPGELRRVLDDRSLLPNAIEESLRLEPAAAVVDRYATRAIHFGGAAIGERDQVTLSLAGANRDPAVFADRPHVCVGMHLARLEARAAVGGVLDRLRHVRLEVDDPPRGLVFRKPPTLHAAWDGGNRPVYAEVVAT